VSHLVEGAASTAGVAIVGMSGRFPKARDLSEFWRNLAGDLECVTFLTADDLRHVGVDPAILDDPTYVNAGLLLEDMDLFDASFFGYNAREAEAMDPQRRVFLECGWHALEDAGYDPQGYEGRIGVFAGCAMSTYLFQLHRNPEFMDTMGFLQVLIGNDKDYLSTHISYKLNLKGPSFTVQSACSTGLLAAAVACRSLNEGECDMALAGASCIRVPEITGYGYHYVPGSIYSPDGHCRPFDADANGTILGNGVGVVVLRRLSDAVSSGDHIYAVIKAAAVNNDGSVKVGYTAPSLDGQAEVIALAQNQAGVKSESVTFIETHGTGTSLGDPIEVAALTQAFNTKERGFCAIGSVKSNIGHLDPAAGIASLIKTALAIKYKGIPGSLHFQKPNHEIDFANSPFYVNTRFTPWNTTRLPRRAGVSAFGIGGTNVHVVLEEPPAAEQTDSYRHTYLYVLSARSKNALENVTAKTLQYFRDNPQTCIADAAYTSKVGRRAFAHRRAVVIRDAPDAVAALSSRDSTRLIDGKQGTTRKRIAFMFSGQGSQYCGMAEGLYQVEPVFRSELDRCAELLKGHLGFDLRNALFPSGDKPDAADRLKQTAVAQPALLAIEYALSKLWMEWGIEPRSMIGHSVGEFVAACLAGVMPVDSALALIAERGRLMQSMPTGAMLAVPLPETEVIPLLSDDGLDIAGVNEVGLCVVSGPVAAIQRFAISLASQDIEARRLHTSHAFHSAMMDPVLDQFTAAVRSIDLRSPRIPFISNVTGTWITEAQATSADYWAKQMRSPVRFADGLSCLLAEHNVLLEVGPGNTLCNFARHQREHGPELLIQNSLRHPSETQSDYDHLLTTLGHLWAAGVNVNWQGFYARERRRRIPLPLYVFDRQRYWVESPGRATKAVSQSATAGKANIADWFYVPSWEKTVEPAPSKSRPQCWLLFDDLQGIAENIAQALKRDGRQVVLVRASKQFGRFSPAEYEIDCRNPEHYRRLCDELRTSGFIPDRIAHLGSVVTVDRLDSTATTFDACQDRGFYSLLYLTQALLKCYPGITFRIVVVSSGLHSIDGFEQTCPADATILAACKCIPQEYSNIHCRNIDIGPLTRERVTDVANSLKLQLASDSVEPIVAYRGSGRWVPTFKPVKLEARPEPLALLRDRGIYLITGGFGNIGLAIAQWLAREIHARLVLIGRTPLPPRTAWPRLLANSAPQDPVSVKIRKLRRLEKLGGEFLLFPFDVADPTEVRSMVTGVKRHFGAINGVFHAAGTVAQDAFFGVDQACPEACERHFRPKARGLLALTDGLVDEHLDFWVLVSSLSSILGGLGFVGYAAANLFLDAYAASQRASLTPWFSINWDAWEFEGPSSDDHSADVPMLPAEGIKTLRRILGAGHLRQTVVSTGSLQARLEKWISKRHPEEAVVSSEVTGRRYERPDLSTDFVAPQNEFEKRIAAVWCDLLGLEHVGRNDNFFDLGGHSLLATQLISRLRAKFALDIPLRLLFECSTIAELASAIESMERRGDSKVEEAPIARLPRESLRQLDSAPSGEPAEADDV
jgi:acyl transferase domain-containing protein/acyl carrier protein